MSRTLCLTPTPISSDIPNKVFADEALAEMHTENIELSHILRKSLQWGDHWGGGSLCRKYVTSKIYHQLDISQKTKKKKKKEIRTTPKHQKTTHVANAL